MRNVQPLGVTGHYNHKGILEHENCPFSFDTINALTF